MSNHVVAIALSGLVALVQGADGRLTLVMPAHGNNSHRAQFEWWALRDDGDFEKRTESLNGVRVVVSGYTPVSGSLDVRRKADCPKTLATGTPANKSEESYDWSVDMKCLDASYEKMPAKVLQDTNGTYVRAKLVLERLKLTLSSTALADEGSKHIFSRFHVFGSAANVPLAQVTSNEMAVTFEIAQRDALTITAYDLKDNREKWKAVPAVNPKSGNIDLAFRNDTNVIACDRGAVDGICIAASQKHFGHYFHFFDTDAKGKPIPWPGQFAEISALESAAEHLDPQTAEVLRTFFGLGPLQGGGGGRPICMMASFKE